ncbi:serine/threonine-protein kinase Smg1 [Brevipalpus obovatus]|uniref:serine/threonine-protein kinase Smg1 n=1 Tax=Brevipalpus obovatus TaxID=246614 RepID=UPI003D9F337F
MSLHRAPSHAWSGYRRGPPNGSGNPFTNLQSLLGQFESGEKRQWPVYLKELSRFFETQSFNRIVNEKPSRVINDVTSVFARILTTKLFPDIIEELIVCLSVFASILNYNCKDLFNWVFKLYYSTVPDETRIVLLSSLVKILEKNQDGLGECMLGLIKKVKKALEEAQTSELLLSINNVFLAAAEHYPASLQPHFRDIVDILIGWHLDSSQPPVVAQYLAGAFTSFSNFWINDFDFTLDLLGQFLEDFEVFYKRLIETNEKSQDLLDSSFTLNKMASLVRVFINVLQSLGDLASPDRNNNMSWDFIINAMKTILVAVNNTMQITLFESLVISTNECAIFTLDILAQSQTQSVSIFNTELIAYLSSVLKLNKNVSGAYILTFLRLLTKYVKVMSANLTPDFITSILRSDSNIQQLRLMPSKEILTSLIGLHHAILSLKNVPVLEEAYRCFLDDIRRNYIVLTGHDLSIKYEDDSSSPLITDDISEDLAIILIQSSFVSLTEIATAKNSIISMWALKPTLFELFTDYLNPIDKKLSDDFSQVQYSIVYILHSHCKQHKHFISTSNLMSSQTPVQTTPISTNVSSDAVGFTFTPSITPQTSGHFAKILRLLSSLLSLEGAKKELLLLCLEWFNDILKCGQQDLQRFVNSPDFTRTLRLAAYLTLAKDPDLCLLSCRTGIFFFKSIEKTPEPDLYYLYFQACLVQIGHVEHSVREAFLSLFACLPLNCFPSASPAIKMCHNRSQILLPDDFRLVQRVLMKTEPSSYFSPACFRTVLQFVLDNQSIADEKWLQRLCHSCSCNQLDVSRFTDSHKNSISDLGTLDSIVQDIFDYHQSILTFWSCWQAIQYCIETKLRTPLGKAQETFTRIEASINNRVLSLRTPPKGRRSNQKIELYQTRMLLLLMENLDKLMYNAYEGNASRLYPTPKPAKVFFIKNKSTCIEWMERNRRSLMMIALKSGDSASVWRHGQELLTEMIDKAQLHEIEFVLTLIVQALMNLRASDAIAGIYTWAKEKLGVRYPWIKCAVDEAQGRYELALPEYQNCSATLGSKDLDPSLKHVKDFVETRILACRLSLGQWSSSLEHQETVKSKSTERKNFFSNDPDLSYLKSWDSLDGKRVPEYESSGNLLWDVNGIYFKCESDLTAMISMIIGSRDKNLKTIQKRLRDIYETTSNVLTTSFLYLPSELNQQFSSLHKIAHNILQIKTGNSIKWTPWSFEGQNDPKRVDCASLVHDIQWLKMLNRAQLLTNPSSSSILTSLILTAAKVARKQQNLKLSMSLLTEYARSSGIVQTESDDFDVSNFHLKSADFMKLDTDSLTQDEKTERFRFYIQGAKHLNAVGDTQAAVETILSCLTHISSNLKSNLDLPAQEILSKTLLNLVKYSQTDQKYLTQIDLIRHAALKQLLDRTEIPYLPETFEPSEINCSKMLQIGVEYCPQMSKSWFALGAWCYRWGKRLVDLEDNKNSPEKKLSQKNQFDFYKVSAKAYFHFLHLREEGCDENMITALLRLLRLIVKHAPELRDILEIGLAKTPTKPWKSIILQLFARLGHPEPYVRHSISELLCRIGQDAPYLIVFPAVAGSFTGNSEDILFGNKIIENQNKNFEDDLSVLGFEEEDADEDKKQDTSLMQNCFASLVDALANQNPELIAQTKTFIHEHRRIIILWDELWIGTLMGHLVEMKKQVAVLQKEIEKVYNNKALTKDEQSIIISEKHRVLLRRIVFILEQTQLITNENPETPHEKWFQNNFAKLIDTTIKELKEPSDPFNPNESLQLYQALLQQLRERAPHYNTARSQMIMSSISPTLAALDATVIPMPGFNFSSNGTLITIEKVHKSITILHTKTKPKKIAFLGSDGRTHTYLFKGHEDLHLDERIMHFLSVVNRMFAKNPDKQGKSLFRARHYSVTPLGTKSGLIQWVDGCSALYSFYKRWLQNRYQQQIQVANQSNRNSPVRPIAHELKPSELFNALLAKKGINTMQRSEWPQNVLVEILQDLMKETPNDLIAKELWCSSSNAHEYWHLTQSFIRSNAVMCMIGYIIGLGDRHLDNVLVDLSTGEVFHIDYNICFEKGKTLQVPERVPCRLTPNIVSAFGLTGVEGTFRISCEHALQVLRKGRETLLTLLEAFLYDPLIDWTPGHEEGFTGAIYGGGRINAFKELLASKYQIEKENAEIMLKIRAIETRGEWASNQQTLNRLLPEIDSRLRMFESSDLSELIDRNNLIDIDDSNFSTVGSNSEDIPMSGSTDDDNPWTCLKEKITALKEAISKHDSLLMEIRQPVRILTKLEERSLGSENKLSGPISQYYLCHRKLLELFYELGMNLNHLSNREFTSKDQAEVFIKRAKDCIVSIQTFIDPLYRAIMSLVDSIDDLRNGKFALTNFDGKPLLSINSSKASSVNKDHSTELEQSRPYIGLERNTYATNVWKRVKMKLDGRDPDPAKRSSVSEQVDYVIEESMKIENLALMYEGWTSWV